MKSAAVCSIEPSLNGDLQTLSNFMQSCVLSHTLSLQPDSDKVNAHGKYQLSLCSLLTLMLLWYFHYTIVIWPTLSWNIHDIASLYGCGGLRMNLLQNLFKTTVFVFSATPEPQHHRLPGPGNTISGIIILYPVYPGDREDGGALHHRLEGPNEVPLHRR